MALLGQAALAMWWDIEPSLRAEFEHWHSHEHFPERLQIDGFRRASRWRSAGGGDGFFVMYELDSHATLSSPAYLERLNSPSLWSTRMMPQHRNMIRAQCRVLDSVGASVARHVLTVRLGPAPDAAARLRASLQSLASDLAQRPGCVGAHLLQHESPAIRTTTEQKIRGGDRAADWVFVVAAYDADELQALADRDLSADSLTSAGASPGAVAAVYALSFAAQKSDLA